MGLLVLTGGQSGVDEGAANGAAIYCEAARPIGQKLTVDWQCLMPKGYKRESTMPSFMQQQKGNRVLQLSACPEYAQRTETVVKTAKAVLLIEHPKHRTPGTKLTLELARTQHKQVWRFMTANNQAVWKAEAHAIAYWLRQMESWVGGGTITLMVAGPRASKWEEGTDVAFFVTRAICDAYERDVHVQPNRG